MESTSITCWGTMDTTTIAQLGYFSISLRLYRLGRPFHSSMQGWFKVPLQRAMTHKSDELGASEDFGEDILSQAFGDALQHALVLVKNLNPAKFAELAL
jgi:hypothetical protein